MSNGEKYYQLRIIRSVKHPGAIFLKNRVNNDFLCKIYPRKDEEETLILAYRIMASLAFPLAEEGETDG